MAISDYLNFQEFFLNDIAGGSELVFFGFMFVLITFFCAKYRFSNQGTLVILLLFSFLMSVVFRNILIIAIFILGGTFVILYYKAILKQE